jgi:hypothetical protein
MHKACVTDLETGGTKPGSAIFSIGAVAVDLDSGEMLSSFYCPIDIQDSGKHGLLDPGTMIWWSKQEEAARNAIFEPQPDAKNLFDALESFKRWYIDNGLETVWGNGATFDVSMLEHFFLKFEIQIPWMFWNVRDLRTLQHLVGTEIRDQIPFEGIKHHALHDAFHEAQYAARMWQLASTAIEKEKKYA